MLGLDANGMPALLAGLSGLKAKGVIFLGSASDTPESTYSPLMKFTLFSSNLDICLAADVFVSAFFLAGGLFCFGDFALLGT